MDKQLIISVLSKDRPGIIADITGVIYELGGDLADLNQSVLAGYLTMILIASFEHSVTPDLLLRRIAGISSPTRLDVVVREMEEPLEVTRLQAPEKTYVVTAQGRNRSGLVHGISSFCYRQGINILDLATTRTEDRYTMILQLDLTAVASISEVRRELQEYADQHGLQVVMQHQDLFRVTNEITF